MSFRSTVLLLSILLLLTAPLGAAPPALSIEFAGASAVVRGLTPHADAILVSLCRVPHKYWSERVRRDRVVPDDDGDGEVRLDLPEGIPLVSIFIAVDLTTGRAAMVTSQGLSPRTIAFHVTPVHGGAASQIAYGRGYAEVLLVRPGVGAWCLSAGDGSALDSDGQPDGVLHLAPGALQPLTRKEAAIPLNRFNPHDVLYLIDPFAMEVYSTEVEP